MYVLSLSSPYVTSSSLPSPLPPAPEPLPKLLSCSQAAQHNHCCSKLPYRAVGTQQELQGRSLGFNSLPPSGPVLSVSTLSCREVAAAPHMCRPMVQPWEDVGWSEQSTWCPQQYTTCAWDIRTHPACKWPMLGWNCLGQGMNVASFL